MKAGWQQWRLRDACDVERVQGLHAGLPYVGLEDIESHTARFVGSEQPISMKSSTFRFSSEHVLYGRLRPYLNKVLAPDFEGHCSTEIFPLKPRSGVVREFVLYWFLRDETVSRANDTARGARMPRANVEEILNFEFLLPPPHDQQRLVGILDEAFEGIAKAKANAERNLENARELFDGRLRSLFSSPPAEWKTSSIGDMCTLKSGTTVPKKLELPAADVPYLKVADLNLPENSVELSVSSRYLDSSSVSANAIFPVGAVMFPKRGGAIATNKKRLTAVRACFDLNIMGVIPSAVIDSWFLYWYFVNIDMRQFSGNGASIPQVNNYDIAPLRFSYPPTKSEQARVAT